MGQFFRIEPLAGGVLHAVKALAVYGEVGGSGNVDLKSIQIPLKRSHFCHIQSVRKSVFQALGLHV